MFQNTKNNVRQLREEFMVFAFAVSQRQKTKHSTSFQKVFCKLLFGLLFSRNSLFFGLNL